jgi:O-antigen ligase
MYYYADSLKKNLILFFIPNTIYNLLSNCVFGGEILEDISFFKKRIVDSNGSKSRVKLFLMRITLFSFQMIAPILLNQAQLVLNFSGSLFTPLISFFCPLILFYSYTKDRNIVVSGKRKVHDLLVVSYCIGLAVFGLKSCIDDIISGDV